MISGLISTLLPCLRAYAFHLNILHLLCSIVQHKLSINKSARYFTLGNVNSKRILLVLHGYGQLAQYFIQKFKAFEDDYYIVAPEGLHRFYVNGSSGRVGASWMTKEAREEDIEDYLNFLDTILNKVLDKSEYHEISVLGFSQGVATMFRWLANGKINPNHCIIASGIIPPDLKISLDHPIFKATRWTYITGDNDPFKNEDEVKSFINLFQTHQIPLNEIVFEGGHTIDKNAVKQALNHY